MLKACVSQHFSRASSRASVEREQESVDRVSTVIVAGVKTLGGEFEVASPAILAPTNPLVGGWIPGLSIGFSMGPYQG